MWDDLKQIALLGSSKSQLSETQIEILERFGIDTTKESSSVVLDALTLWSKMKAVGVECEKWDGDATPSKGTRGNFASANLSKQVGVIFKYKGYEKLLPELFEKLVARDTNFPAEHLPKLMVALKSDGSLYFKIKEGLDDRFYWLAKQHPSWKIYDSQGPARDFQKTKIAAEKKQILLMWLNKDQEEAVKYLKLESNNLSHDFWKELFEKYATQESMQNDNFAALLESLLVQKNKLSFGICSILLMHYPNSTFAQKVTEQVSKILIVNQEAIDVNEAEIDKLKTLIPKSCLPFSNFKSRDKVFDKNLFYHALSITSPEILFAEHFKMEVDDFLNTVTHLGFYDELIIQAMIFSSTKFQYKDLLNGLIKMFRRGDFPQCNWRPILDLLPAKALNGELNRLLQDEKEIFDHRHAHLFFARNFEWPPKAVEFYSNILSEELDQQKLGKRDLFYQLFEQMILKCNPNFFYDLKSQLVTDRVFSFHSNSLIEKQLKLLKLRLEIEKELKVKK